MRGHYTLSRHEEAIRYYTAALALRPHNPVACVNLGSAFYALGDVDAAIRSYREALDGHPDYALAHETLGVALERKGDLDGGIAHIRKATQFRHRAWDHMILGGMLLRKGLLQEAIDSYGKAIELNPKHAAAWNFRGAAYCDRLDQPDVTGTLGRGNHYGVLFDEMSRANEGGMVGGTTSGAGNLISGNSQQGVLLGVEAQGVLVQGNYIGTDVTGTHAIPNNIGIEFGGSDNTGNQIGGKLVGAGNLISGNSGDGVFVTGTLGPSVVLGNLIGTDVTGSVNLGNGQDGVELANGATGTTIGGTVAAAANVIAFNSNNGVSVHDSGTVNNPILGNSIHDNKGLGIDDHVHEVFADSEMPNSPQNSVTDGGNNLQNHPVLTNITWSDDTAGINGTLNSYPNTKFRVEFYANPAVDPSGYGQGQTYLGTTSVTTDANGNASFSISLQDSGAAGQVITATATDPAGNTSEFSADVNAAPLLDATTTTISAPTITYGANATVQVTVSSPDATPSGDATLSVDGGAALTAPLSATGAGNAVAVFTLTTPAAGNYSLDVSYAEQNGFAASSASGSLQVNPADLTVTADDQTKGFGTANPDLTFTLSGFVNGDTAAVVSGSPTLSTTATTDSDVGSYPITVVDAGTLSAANYDFPAADFVNGTLTVTPVTPTITWGNPAGGDWDTAVNWLGGVVPGANDDVVIDVPVTNPITHSQNVTDQIKSLSVTAMDPIDLVSGVLEAGNIDSNGSLTLGGGALAGATISKQTAITATQAGGILDGLTVDGFLDLGSTTGVTATVAHGLTLDGLVTIAQGGVLAFPTTEMLAGTGQVYFADANALNSVSETGSGTFTIGSNVTIFGNTGRIDGGIGTLINQGTVTGDVGAGLVTINGVNWSNAGTIKAASGGAVKLTGTWTSSGAIQAYGGGTANLDGTLWSNTGTINAIDSTVNLGGAFTTAGLGNLQRAGGEVNLTGTLNNLNSVLNLDSYTGSWQLMGGAIDGGQVSTSFQGDPAARDDLYDAGQGFSTTQNPSGAWSYGWTPTLGGAFTLDTQHTDFEGDQTWAGSLDGQGDPFVGLNVYQAEQDGVPVANIPPILSVEQTPGPHGEYSVVRWTAPSAGSVVASANYEVGSSPRIIAVLHNGVSLGQADFENSGEYIGPTPSIAVAAGDTIDFVLGAGHTKPDLWLADSIDVDFTHSGLPTALVATTQGGTLDDVTLAGGLDLATIPASSVTVNGDLTDNGAVRVAQGSSLVFAGPGTLGGSGEVLFADANPNNDVSEGGTGTFTIGPNVTIHGNTGKIDGGIGTLINQGTVTGDVGAGLVTVTGTNWSNAGTIGADPGGAIKLTGTWTNSGAIHALGGGTASLDGTSWSNTGAITAIDATVNLGGAFTTAGLGNFQRFGGLVNLTGTLNNTNAVLNLDSYMGSWQMAGGTIQGGQVATNHFATSTNTLDVYDANKDFSLAQNPNGPWSYGWTPTLVGTFTLDALDKPNFDHSDTFWGGNIADNGDPRVSLTTVPFGGNNLGQGIQQTTGPDGEYSVVRWTAPSGGVIAWYGDYLLSHFNLSLNPDVEVLDNGQSIAQVQITSEDYAYDLGGILDTSLPVAQGDTIDFAVRGLTGAAFNMGVWFRYSQQQSLLTALIATTQGGTLDGVTLAGSLDLTTIPGSTLAAIHGLTVNPALGEGGVNIGTGSSLVVTGGFNQQAGTSVIDGSLNADSVNLGASSYLSGAGVIQGNVTNAGHVGNAATPENLTIKGNFTQTASGVLDTAITATSTGGYGTLTTTGTATFAGGVDIHEIGDLLPNKGQTFTLLTAQGHLGKFSAIAGLPSDLSAGIFNNAVVLTASNPTPAELAIAAKYKALGGAAGVLGAAGTGVMAMPSGTGFCENFQNGTIFWSAATGAHDIYGPIAVEYAATASEQNDTGIVITLHGAPKPIGSVQNALGLATSDQAGLTGGGQVANFQGGTIYWSAATNAHVLYGPIAAAYTASAKTKNAAGQIVQTIMGLPTSDEASINGVPGGRIVTFHGGDILWSRTTGAHVLYGPIAAEYDAIATAQETDAFGTGVQQILGMPTADEANFTAFAGARVVTFQGGNIYWSQGTGAHVLYGAIGAEYIATAKERNNLGIVTTLHGVSTVQTALGLPTSDEEPLDVGGDRFVNFQAGGILWSQASGAHALYGPIGAEYSNTSAEFDAAGNSVQQDLGLPMGEQIPIPGVVKGVVLNFQGGSIYSSLASGTHVLYGPIAGEYAATAGERDAGGIIVQKLIGLPTADETDFPGVAGAQVVTFQGGNIYWSPSSNGAHVLYGAIGAEYAATAQEQDVRGDLVQAVLGLPTTDEGDFRDVAGARVVYFQGGGGIYWTSTFGAHAVYGDIGKDYMANAPALGAPTTEETDVPGVSGGRTNKFQYGEIYYSPNTPASAVYGDIDTEYKKLGGPLRGTLGFPISDEEPIPAGRENFFQYGKILDYAKTGAYPVDLAPSIVYNQSVGFSDNTPVGGSASVTFFPDGSYTFTGQVTDTGWPSYDYTVVLTLISPSGNFYSFPHSGHLAGKDEPGSPNDDWSVTGKLAAFAGNYQCWRDLQGYTDQWRISVSSNVLGDLIHNIGDFWSNRLVGLSEEALLQIDILAFPILCDVIGQTVGNLFGQKVGAVFTVEPGDLVATVHRGVFFNYVFQPGGQLTEPLKVVLDNPADMPQGLIISYFRDNGGERFVVQGTTPTPVIADYILYFSGFDAVGDESTISLDLKVQ